MLHAGDLLEASLLDELARYAPVRAVKGNVDGPDVRLPATLEFSFGGVPIAMIHDSGPKRGRRARMRRRFPGARVVVFGHSHVPLLEDDGELLLLNPGSPTDRRRQPEHTFALLRAEGGEARARLLALSSAAPELGRQEDQHGEELQASEQHVDGEDALGRSGKPSEEGGVPDRAEIGARDVEAGEDGAERWPQL